MDQVFVFANPIAGRGMGRTVGQRVVEGLKSAGFGVEVHSGRVEELGREELSGVRRARAIVVVGGDGTLRAVVGRVLAACAASAIPPVALVPMGTANLMGRHLGLNLDAQGNGEELARMIRAGHTLEVDAARVRCSADTAGGAAEGLMLLVAGVGVDAQIVHELSRIRSGPITKLSYAFPAALALRQYRFPSIAVSVDQKGFWSGQGIVVIGNVKEYGTGFAVLPEARADDGLLDVCAMPCRSWGELVTLFLHAMVGEHLKQEGVVYVKGRSVNIEADAVPVQVDGEAAGFTPVRIDMMDRRIPFLVP